MTSQHYRYFIELQPRDGVPAPRFKETEDRRAIALGFLQTFRDWLKQQDLSSKVSALTVTLFGQIQITCDADVIQRVRHQDLGDIASIRQGMMYRENPGRWHQAH